MPDTKISALTAASSLADTDELVVASAGASKKITGANLKASIPGTLPVTIFDAKGDLIVASGPDAGARVPVGTDGQVLQADSAQALGLKWATPAGGAAGALTLLSTTTLASPGTFDISGISGAYNDLILVLIGRGTDAGAQDNPRFVLNNDTAANYYTERITVNGTSAATGAEAVGTSFFQIASLPAAGATANHFVVIELTIYGYASTAWKKVCQWDAWWPRGLASSDLRMERGGALWSSTAAVTRVTINGMNTANLLTGSQLRIYGRL
jgi:hypothetical protein